MTELCYCYDYIVFSSFILVNEDTRQREKNNKQFEIDKQWGLCMEMSNSIEICPSFSLSLSRPRASVCSDCMWSTRNARPPLFAFSRSLILHLSRSFPRLFLWLLLILFLYKRKMCAIHKFSLLLLFLLHVEQCKCTYIFHEWIVLAVTIHDCSITIIVLVLTCVYWHVASSATGHCDSDMSCVYIAYCTYARQRSRRWRRWRSMRY